MNLPEFEMRPTKRECQKGVDETKLLGILAASIPAMPLAQAKPVDSREKDTGGF
jgi:hypothetical protein